MKYFKALFIAVTLFAGLSAQAFPKHTLTCLVGDERNRQQLYLEIEDSNVAAGLAQVTLSNWSESPMKWVPFQQAQVKVELSWIFNPMTSQNIIADAKVDLGRTGAISILTSEKSDEYNSLSGEIHANVMGFNYVNGIKAQCSYFLVSGVRPALTGSN